MGWTNQQFISSEMDYLWCVIGLCHLSESVLWKLDLLKIFFIFIVIILLLVTFKVMFN